MSWLLVFEKSKFKSRKYLNIVGTIFMDGILIASVTLKVIAVYNNCGVEFWYAHSRDMANGRVGQNLGGT